MKNRALLCATAIVAFLAVAPFTEAQGASTLDSIKTLLDSGTVKTIGVYVSGAQVFSTVPLQSISTSQYPLLIVDDQKSSLKAMIDLSKVVAYVFWKGILTI